MPVASYFFAVFMAMAQSGGIVGPSVDVAAASGLYAAGDYEGALSRLSAVKDGDPSGEAAQYGALCLLALGRTEEAQHSLEELFTRMPLFKMSETEVAPRLVTMFNQVRGRLLPATVKTMYANAKTSYDQKQYAAASSQFRIMLALLADADLADEAKALSDLKLLGDGFLKLTESELALTLKADARPDDRADVRSGSAPMPSPLAIGLASATVYSATDKDVIAPVEVSRRMPSWVPPDTVTGRQGYDGFIRLVVNEQGAVESARIVDSVSDTYDPLLLAAARDWRFKPARRNGQDVKYAVVIAIALQAAR